MKKQASHSTSASSERSRQIEKRCLAYALAVGGTALVTAPAKAEIVYTPTNVSTLNGTIFVDLNNDGISDIKLYDFCRQCTSSGQIESLEVRGAQNPSAFVIGRKSASFAQGTAWPAPYGFSIGPNSPKRFIGPLRTADGPTMVYGYNFFFPADFDGPWQNASNKYLGIQFGINGQTHYGWARLSVRAFTYSQTHFIHIKVTLTGYAYETQPNTAILAGDEGPKAQSTAADARGVNSPSLGLLSLGSVGLDVWRRH